MELFRAGTDAEDPSKLRLTPWWILQCFWYIEFSDRDHWNRDSGKSGWSWEELCCRPWISDYFPLDLIVAVDKDKCFFCLFDIKGVKNVACGPDLSPGKLEGSLQAPGYVLSLPGILLHHKQCSHRLQPLQDAGKSASCLSPRLKISERLVTGANASQRMTFECRQAHLEHFIQGRQRVLYVSTLLRMGEGRRIPF